MTPQPFAPTANPSTRRRLLSRGAALLSGSGIALLAGCAGGKSTPTPNPLERGEVTEKEHAIMKTSRAMNSAGPHVGNVREIATPAEGDGFRVEIRFGLNERQIPLSKEQRISEAKEWVNKTAVTVMERLSDTTWEQLQEVRMFAYVSTESQDVETAEDGKAVGIELAVTRDALNSTDWSDYKPPSVPEDAAVYEVNDAAFTAKS